MNNSLPHILTNRERDWCMANAVHVTHPGQSDYPEGIADLENMPQLLYYLGEPAWKEAELLSVVGSRNPSPGSLTWLEKSLQLILDRKEIVIVSGGARGIDQKAHQMALRNGRKTVIFVPAGLASLYPYTLNDWVKPILQSGGALVSQFSPFTNMHKRFFQERNQLIAAISPGTLIVEAKRSSGTMLTANYALELGRGIGVMPTAPTDSGLGGLDLIVAGALPIRDGFDLLVFTDSAKTVKAKQKESQIGHPNSQASWNLS